jgi:DNA helicase-2/ATP-dependent DNA helicase PcrA
MLDLVYPESGSGGGAPDPGTPPRGRRRSPEELLDGLNPVQAEIVAAPDGPILVVAGAGSGKTRVLTHRVAWLISAHDVSPFGILAITFTNKAADEMKERVAGLIGNVARKMWVSTFHAACARMLRYEAAALGLRSSFSIYDQSDANRLVGYVVRDLNLDAKRFAPRKVHAAISAAKNELLDPEAYAGNAVGPIEKKIAQVYAEYQKRLQEASALDFDDLLVRAVELLRDHPDVLARWRGRFEHVLVDEFQDTNIAQWELVRLLAEEKRNVMVVGDVDQSIYRFRGADFRNLLRFEEAFPEASVVVLEQNYRSSQVILDAANAVIANNSARRPKNLWTDRIGGELITTWLGDDEVDEARFVTGEITRLTDEGGHRFGDIAVFYRTNAQSRVVEEQLVRSGIPYKVFGGVKFYDRREVKDALAYLRILANPDDGVSFRRVVNTPKRGVGDTSVAKLDAYAQGAGLPIAEALRDGPAAGITGKAVSGLHALADVLDEMRQAAVEGRGLAHVFELMLDRTGYVRELEAERSVEAQGRIENLRELVGVAADFDDRVDRGDLTGPAAGAVAAAAGDDADPDAAAAAAPPTGLARVQAFLESLALVTDMDEYDGEQSTVTLMTLHSAKGLEYPIVFLAGLEEGVFPHIRSLGEPVELEEERRLCYVGITRAMERLYLTHTWSRSLFGSTQYNPPSRFLGEIPEALQRRVGEQTGGGRRRSSDDRSDPEARRWGGSSDHRERVVAAALRDAGRYRDAEEAGRRSSAGAAVPGARGAERAGLRIGDDVTHEKFGEGVILDMRGEGDKTEARVRFRGVGEKTLLLAWAPLTRIER